MHILLVKTCQLAPLTIYFAQGEYIDTTIGVTLGISTMAAAGIGNMISDLAGLGLADQVSILLL